MVYLDNDDEGLRRIRYPPCCGGVVDDLSRRSKFCAADWLDGLRHWKKTLSAALFMFFATFFSTVALGALIQKATGQRIGLLEYLLMNACAGVAHAIFGVQPLLVLRPTGPITSIITKLSELADVLHLDFYEYFAATGCCVGLLMGLVASFEVSRLIARVTPFTHDIFACFVCSIYLHDGVADVVHRFGESDFGEALLETNLALLTFGVSLSLFGAPRWRILPPSVRAFLQDYAVTIAVLAAAGATALVTRYSQMHVQRIPLATGPFGPTCMWNGEPLPTNATEFLTLSVDGASPKTPTCANAANTTIAASARPWIAWSGAGGLSASERLRLWALALCSAVPITFFFYMDQNISSLLSQLRTMGLARGRYFHASFLYMGVFCAVGPMLGLPFVTGSLPHSPQLVKALTSVSSPSPNDPRPVMRVAESRIAPLVAYALISLPLFAPSVLEPIPEAAIDGVLAYVGVEGIVETMLWRRTMLLLAPSSELPPRLHAACRSARIIHLYTLVQLLALAAVWAVNVTPAGLCVSFVIVSFVPFRERLLPVLFEPSALAALDSELAFADDDAADEPPSQMTGRASISTTPGGSAGERSAVTWSGLA